MTRSAALALAVATAAALLACRTPQGAAPLPALAPADVDPARGYETPPVLHAEDLLPEALRRGPHHVVVDEVHTDGFRHLYVIESDFGVFRVRGDALLRQRVHEIGALARLRELQETRAFAERLASEVGRGAVARGYDPVREPVETVWGVPPETFRKVLEAAREAPEARDAPERDALRAFGAFEERKRLLAERLGVDPYSANFVLQRELNRLAWAEVDETARSALTADLGPTGFGALESGDAELLRLLGVDPPEDLRRRNRIELAVMGVDDRVADAFLAHGAYSPGHRTRVVAALIVLEGAENRGALVEAALHARDEGEALLYQRVAEFLAAYHTHAEPLVRLERVESRVRGTTAGGVRVTSAEVDHLIWTRPTERMADQGAVDDGTRHELWLSGTASEKARRELEARGIHVVERCFERLAAAPPDAGGRE